MKTKKIYIVRHGQTDYNLRGIVQGRGVDAPLNKTGRLQARQFFEAYQHEGFDYILTSTLQRTQQSVQGFIDQGIPHKQMAGLDEIGWGKFEGVVAGFADKQFFKELTAKWAGGQVDLAIEAGESPAAVAQRQAAVIEFILEVKATKLLVCMHGRALRIFLTQLLGLPIAEMDRFAHTNLCLYVLENQGKIFKLLVENDTTHLQKNITV